MKLFRHFPSGAALLCCLASPVLALPSESLVQPLGSANLTGWSGVRPEDSGAVLTGADAVYRIPDGPHGWYKHGFRLENDGTRDWRDFYGLTMNVRVPNRALTRIEVSLSTPDPGAETVTATATIAGPGWHTVTLPWSMFDFDQARNSFLKYAKEVRISSPAGVEISDVRVVRAENVALIGGVLGRSAERGGDVEYTVAVGNPTDVTQAVSLHLVRHGWENMAASVEPDEIELDPGMSRSVTVRVHVTNRIAPGGHEVQTLCAVGNGDASHAAYLTFTTACALPHPYILHTPAQWQEVRDKIGGYAWARDSFNEYRKQADDWVVPEIAAPPHNDPDDTMGPFLFTSPNANALIACAVAWQVTRDKKYAEKIALFMRRLSDPEKGYPKTLRGFNQALVQEGQNFQMIAMAYDAALDSDVFSDADRAQIETTLRLYMDTVTYEMQRGSINNWNLAEDIGAFYCALALQDLAAANHFFADPCGIQDQLAKGTMDDGWWYECSISYNVWCASEFSQVALAWEPWGVNFKDAHVPASYSLEALLSPPSGTESFNGARVPPTDDPVVRHRPFGMCKEIWGPMHRPYREIRDLWNGLLPFVDYRGVMFGLNDSTENLVDGFRRECNARPFELAYYLYRDPAYAALIPRDGKRDLLYGVPDLPPTTSDASKPKFSRQSAYADNVGLAMLRSQTPNRLQSDQIQAALHYGTHGWAHGHFDRTNLVSLMRYGRSFYNPESIWYGYEPFMYKFYVQTSDASNMVVVDQKMQEPTESSRLLFHTGKMMQAAAVETDARWSNPPYGGMVYDYVPVKTFAEKCWREGRYVPVPKDAPAYGSLTGFTEKVLQRRLLIVTDDYVVLADYLKSDKPHTFDNLLQLSGFLGLDAPEKTFLRHDPQWSDDPLSSAQFVTDCDWYRTEGTAHSRFHMNFAGGVENPTTRTFYNAPGTLNLDVYSAWPRQQQIMIGNAPEDLEVHKQLTYTVRADGKTVDSGKFGAWILGKADIDIPVSGIKSLDLQASAHGKGERPTIFWAGARIVTKDGREIPLSQLPVTFENTRQPKSANLDYFGGPVKIEGVEYATSTPGQPIDDQQPSVVHVDLTGIDAVRFKATLGGDYPLGDESQFRKTYCVRTQGTSARFLTVIEPSEDKRMVTNVEAIDADHLRVTLADGRVQEISIANFEGDGHDVAVSIAEFRDGKIVRSETTSADK